MNITLILDQSTLQSFPTPETATSGISGNAVRNTNEDSISISAEGKALSEALQSSKAQSLSTASKSEDTEETAANSTLETLKKLIEQLEKEIEEIETQNLPEEEKESKLASLRTELTQAQLEYAQALKDESGAGGSSLLSALGSSAEGFANSLT